jgi:O-antigen/teichoic acid export membrane protein
VRFRSESPHKVVQMFWNLLAVGAGNYGAMGLALVINAVLARRLGAEQFGRLALLLVTSQVVSLLVANWTHTALIRFGAREFGSVGSVAETFWTRIWILIPWILIAGATMFAFRDRLAGYLTIPVWAILVLLAHFLASVALATIGAVFQAKEDMHRYGAVLFLDKAVMAVLLFLLPLAWVRDPVFILGLYAVSSTSVAVWGALSLGRRSLAPVVVSGAAYRMMLAFSLPLILSSWAGLFGTAWFDLLVIKRYRPLSELGLYSLGTMLAGVMQQITIIFSTLLLPQLSVMVANGEIDTIARLVDRLFPYWFLGTSILFSLVLLVGGPIVPLVFGRSFQPAVPVLAVLMVATCALAFFTAFSPVVSAFGSSWVLTSVGLVAGGVNVVMDLLLIPRYGIEGAAAASVFAYATAAVWVLRFAQGRLHTNTFGLSVLALPVVIVSCAFFLLDGVRFYLFAVPGMAISVYWLIRRFQLFSREDAGFLRGFPLVGPIVSAGRTP